MNRLETLITIVGGFTVLLIAAQVSGLIAIAVASGLVLSGLVCKLWSIHRMINSAEIDLRRMTVEWSMGSASRVKKRIERTEDTDWVARATVAAVAAPAARYHQAGQGILPAAMTASRGPQHDRPAINVVSIHESSPRVKFVKPGLALMEYNESDRKKSSDRTRKMRANAFLYDVLFHGGTHAARLQIRQFRGQRKPDTPAIEINSHLEQLSYCSDALVWLALRIFRHPGPNLAVRADINTLFGWDALHYMQHPH